MTETAIGLREPDPAESFGVEYLNVQWKQITDALSQMGFQFTGSGPVGDGTDQVFFNGQKPDGTQITLTITKGSRYKSPAEIAAAKSAQESGKK